ncbi:hypothetical protein LRS56_29040 [Pseudomonas poae]|nr:hypothetical protein LRS56_29040 [Pseudomonas poae]
METSENDLVRTSSLFLIRNAQPRLQPLIVVDAIPNAGGLVPLSTAANDLRIRIPVPPQPGPPGSRATIRVYAELPPPAEYEVLSYQQLPTYPTAAVDITVPRRLVGSEGDYQLTYILDDGSNVLRATASTPLRVQKTPPFGYLTITPPRPLLPANLATPLITEEYLANNDPVLFRIPEHAEINNEIALRAVVYYGNTDSHMEVAYAVPPVTALPDFPAVRLIPVPAAIIRARGNGPQQLTYRCLDREGNRARDSLILEVRVALRITPSNIAIPRVTQAIAPDNTVTLGDITQGGQGGMEVWLDSVDGLQIGDVVGVTLGAASMPTSLIYAGQPLPLRFIVTTAQIQAALAGAANNDTTTAVGFRIISGGVVFNGPGRTLTFNLSTLMTLALPIVQNLNSEGNLNCNSPQPLNAPYPNRSIAVFIPPSAALIPGRTLTLTCALSRQDNGSNPIVPAVTVSTVLAADAPTLGLTLNLPYTTTMRVIGRGVMYFSYSMLNNANQLLRSAPVAIGVRGVLAGNVYCDGTPFTPTP